MGGAILADVEAKVTKNGLSFTWEGADECAPVSGIAGGVAAGAP